MLNYKNFDPKNHKVKDIDDVIEILNMFQFQFTKKECAMSNRDEKWAGGLQQVKDFLYQIKSGSWE